MAKRPTTGIGALAGARGEITILDGKLVVSYGKSDVEPPAAGETAALLATGTAAAWQVITVDHDIEPDKIEAYLVNRARAFGLDPERSFPFQFSGVIAPYALNVNAAPTNGSHGIDRPMAISVRRKGDTIGGHVAGLYVSPDLVGIVTQGGERIHSHWVASDRSETAHLDRWGIKAGSVLMLPKPL